MKSILGLPFVLLLAGFGSGEAVVVRRECVTGASFATDEADPIILVDAALWADGVEALEQLDVASIELLCWNPETGKFGRSGGLHVISVVREELSAAFAEPLEALTDAQRAFFRTHGRYATRLDQLGVLLGDNAEPIAFQSQSEGWFASTGSEDSPLICTVFLGELTPEESTGTSPGIVRCLPSTRALRAAYEGRAS